MFVMTMPAEHEQMRKRAEQEEGKQYWKAELSLKEEDCGQGGDGYRAGQDHEDEVFS